MHRFVAIFKFTVHLTFGQKAHTHTQTYMYTGRMRNIRCNGSLNWR